MPIIHPAALERELLRGMRPDAHRFIRPDWRRQVKPGSDLWALYERFERKYSPDQPRVPTGVREGGQWSSEDGGGSNTQTESQRRGNENIVVAASSGKRGSGHHYVPGAEIRNRGVSEEASKVFRDAKTGPLYDPRSNLWDKPHRAYNDAVGDALDVYLAEKGTPPDKMTADQAREFLGRVYESRDPRIRDYNMGIQMRELMQRLLRRGGRE